MGRIDPKRIGLKIIKADPIGSGGISSVAGIRGYPEVGLPPVRCWVVNGERPRIRALIVGVVNDSQQWITSDCGGGIRDSIVGERGLEIAWSRADDD